jgi:hypothetical protein
VTESEVEDVLSSLIGDEEIHKLIKQSEDYYLLHTCEERTEKNVCMRGLVYVIERDEGILVVRPEMWAWIS